MDKKKVVYERELNSRSAKIIWTLISKPEGLAKWIADNVERNDEMLEFTWGVPWRHHEKRTAKIVEESPMSHFRWAWEDDTENFVELRMERSDITNDYILTITDFTDEDDEEWLNAVWDKNFDRLHHATGL